jgi:NhaA family Na+:H+ antiporter
MGVVQRRLSNTFKTFFDSEKSSGILLIISTVVSLLLANSTIGASYLGITRLSDEQTSATLFRERGGC